MEETELIQSTITELRNQEWFNGLIEDCHAIVVETGFASRMAIIEGYHGLGKRVSEEKEHFDNAQIYGQKIVKCIAQSIGKSERSVQYAVQFYEKYPDLSLLPEGKNVSWSLITQKYLPKPKDESNKEGSNIPQSEEPSQTPKPVENLLVTPVTFTIKELLLLIEDHNFGEFNDLVIKRIKDAIGVQDLSPVAELYRQEKTNS